MVVPDMVVTAMTRLVLQSLNTASTLSLSRGKVPTDVLQAAQDMLKQCLRHETMSGKTSLISLRLATEANWLAWSALVVADDTGAALSSSIEPVRHALSSFDDAVRQLEALSTVVGLISKVAGNIVASLVSSIGADVTEILLTYGTIATQDSRIVSHRTVACADSIKFLLVGYQYLIRSGAGDGEGSTAPFLQVLFECLLGVLRTNGLPNHPSTVGGVVVGDVSLGRMSAQAIVTAARTTPGAFKSCLAQMEDVDRALIEFAVRGAMSGYASSGTAIAGQEPAKKTLNAAIFKR
jgi:hypothetical protein